MNIPRECARHKLTLLTLIIAGCSIGQGISTPPQAGVCESPMGAILNYSQLQQYLHPEIAERRQVYVKTNEPLAQLGSATKFGNPVIVFSSDNHSPALEVIEFHTDSGRATFKMRYEVEGVVFSGTLLESDGCWRTETFDLFEHSH